jgi:hypothetical protein
MSNIPKEKLYKIADQSSNMIEEVNNSILWVEQYLKAEDKSIASYDLKKIRRELKKIKFSITQKPAAALYGESQVGKSYLIKNLLSTPGKELKIFDISNNNNPHGFLEEINPKGDQTEATSVVTRFSIDKHFIDERYPIKINLLSPKDIVLFLCDSYYSDITDHLYAPKPNEISQEVSILAEEFRKYPDLTQFSLSEDEIFEIKEYLDLNFRMNTDRFNDASFWSEVSLFIHKVPPSEWYKVFQIIWGKLSAFNDIFNKLIKELERLRFNSSIYAEFKSVLRQFGTLLHVARLREIELGPVYEDVNEANFEPNVRIMFQHNGSQIEQIINKSILCALCGELILQISSDLADDKVFLKNSDLLDFPGARSRLENKESAINKDHIDLMVLRGKVSYIFNKYTSDRLISNLLFCNRDAKIEVKYIPKLLNNWIEYYIGKTPTERYISLKDTEIPPIFIIFTFFNNDLKFNEKNDRLETLSEKWMKRFITIFENEIITKNFNWHKNWVKDAPFFQNFYLLRDFTHSKETYSGYSESNTEGELIKGHFGDKFDNHQDYFNKLKESFLKFPFVIDHFKNPKLSWDESAMPNKDGSDLIIERLTSVSTNEVRTYRFINLLNECKENAYEIIEKHYHSDKSDEQIKTAARTGADIHANMNMVFSKNPYHFGRFIKSFMISESSIYNFYHEQLKNLDLITKTNLNQYIYFRESSPELSNKKSYQENLEVLKNTYHLRDLAEVESYFKEKEVDLNELFYGELNALKNNSLTLAEGLRSFWFDTYLQSDRFKTFIDDGFSKSSLDKLLENIRINFTKQRIVYTIADHIKYYVDRYDKINQAEEMIADISAGLINKFVNSVGWLFYSENEVEKIIATSNANDLKLVLPVGSSKFEAMSETDLNKLFEDIEHLNENLSQTPPNEEAIKNVPVIRQYRRWRDMMKVSFIANCDIPTYNVEGNRKLGALLDKIRVYKFSAD